MGILIRETPEALSDQSLSSLSEGTLNYAASAAGNILQHELLRYCAGSINGRSFLIAGHRGAGKTTTVNTAIDTVLRRLRKDADLAGMRPLPVFLHGPSLFEPEQPAAAPPQQSSPSQSAGTTVDKKAAADQAAEGAPAPKDKASADLQSLGLETKPPATSSEQAKVALVQVILGLHRAAVREFVRCYRHVQTKGEPPLTQGRYDKEGRETAELAAQFEVEIVEDPTAARLQDFWAEAGALDSGVLFEAAPVSDQGWRELVALNGLCNAHQRISGDISAKDQVGRAGSTDQTRTKVYEIKGTELLKPITAVAAGVAVTGVGAVGSGDVVASGVAGLLAALLASYVFKSSTTSTEKRSRQLDTTFIPDLSLRTLDRVLPTLLNRLRRAGLAPVLIIDELDKVPDLPARLRATTHFLKKLVAEDVFTCFLTDRGYLEHLRVTGTETAYGLAYSYFSHPLLITFTPDEFDRYIRALLVTDTPPAQGPAGAGPESSSDLLDIQVLPWMLRHRSRLHALALARELALLRGDRGQLLLRTGAVRSDSLFRVDVTFQVALELQLKSKQVQGWSRQRPDMLQVLNDTLYFLSREWLEGVEMLNLGSAGKLRLKEKLCARMNLVELSGSQPQATASTALSEQDLDLLFSIVVGMVAFLRQDNDGKAAGRAWSEANMALEVPLDECPLPQPVLDALLLGGESLLYAVPLGSTDSFRWRYDTSGNPRHDAAMAARSSSQGLPIEAAIQAMDRIWEVERALREVFETEGAASILQVPMEMLADRLRVLPTSPAWARVEPALRNLELARDGRGNPASLAEDCQQAIRFDAMITASLAVVIAFMRMSAFLTEFCPSGSRSSDLLRCMQVLSKALRFSRRGVDGVGQALAEFETLLSQLWPVGSPPPFADNQEKQDFVLDFGVPALRLMIGTSRTAGAKFRQSLNLATLSDRAWSDLQERALALRYARPLSNATPAEVLCALTETGPGAIGLLDFESMSLRAWSSLLLRCLSPREGQAKSESPPPWLAALALRRLGADNLEPVASRHLRQALLPFTHSADQGSAAAADQLLSSEGSSSRFAVLLTAELSVAESWYEPPTSGLLVAVGEKDWPLAKALIRDRTLDIPLLLIRENDAWMDEKVFADEAEELNRRQPKGVWTAHAYDRKRRSMLKPSIVDPQGPDDLLAYFTQSA